MGRTWRMWTGSTCIAFASLVAVGCASESHADQSFATELRAVVAQADLDVASDGTVVAERTLRVQCNNPGFDRESPAIAYDLPSPEGSEGALLEDLVGRVKAQGWSVGEIAAGKSFTGETDGGGFAGLLSSPSPGVVSVTVWLDADWTC